MPPAIDTSAIAGTVTRNVGPLPLWGWAIAVGGAIFAYRMVKGGGSSPTPVVTPGPAVDTGDGSPTAGDIAGNVSTFGAGVVGATGTPGPTGATGAPGPLATPGNLYQAALDAFHAGKPGAYNPGTYANFVAAGGSKLFPIPSVAIPTSYTNLLVQIQAKMTALQQVYNALANTRNVINQTQDAYDSRRISKATYDARMKSYNATVASEKAAVTKLTGEIAALQTALGKLH